MTQVEPLRPFAGRLADALSRLRGGPPGDPRAYGDLLGHCAREGRLFRAGAQLHARLVVLSATPLDNSLASRLLAFYSRHDRLQDARKVFDAIPHPTLNSHNALLAAYSRHPDPSLCLRHFSSLASRLRPDAFSVSALLKSLSRAPAATAALREIHGYVVRSHLAGSDLYVGNGLVGLYSRFGDLGYARKVFEGMPVKDVVTWNSIISGCSQSGLYHECLEFYRRMGECCSDGPDNVTVISVLRACTQLEDYGFGVEVHRSFAKNGISIADPEVSNSLVGFYARCGKLEYARKLFDEMPQKDDVTYGALISGYMSHGLVEQALELFARIRNPALSTWNCLISGSAHNGRHSDALSLFLGMQQAGFRPNSVTLASILPSISFLSDASRGKEVHGYAIRACLDRNPHIIASLIDMYSKAGILSMAHRVFQGATSFKSLIIWTAILSACAAHGDGHAAVALFSEMAARGITPDSVAFTVILAACANAGLVEEARRFFASMLDEYRIRPTRENCACMVAALSRAGLLNEAVYFVSTMPMEPTAKAWGALLNGASMWGDAKIGRMAFDRLVRVDPRNMGNYVIMANIYSRAGEWEEASRIRNQMKGVGLDKLPGCSWI